MIKSKKRLSKPIIALVLFLTLTLAGGTKAFAAVTKTLYLSMFIDLETVKSPLSLRDDRDTPEGFCITGKNDTAYVTKIHEDGTTTVIKYPNLWETDAVYPNKNLKLGHANDLTYYDGYLYVAGLNKKIYRLKDNGKNSDGKETYTIDTFTVDGLISNKEKDEKTWNITHYTGKYFIICTNMDDSLLMTFRIGYFDNAKKKFIIKKTFYGKAKEFKTIQGLTYAKGKLYQTTSDNGGSKYKNKISIYNIGTSYDKIENKTYSLNSYGTFDKHSEKDKDNPKFEIESLDIANDGWVYVLVNVKGINDPIYTINTPLW